MALRFDDIPGLIAYWNTGEAGTVQESGGVVSGITAGYPGTGGDLALSPGADGSLKWTGTKIGELPAVDNVGTSVPASSLFWDFPAGVNMHDQGMTVVAVDERRDNNGVRALFRMDKEPSASEFSIELSGAYPNDKFHRPRVNWSTADTFSANENTKTIHVLTTNVSNNSCTHYMQEDGVLHVDDDLGTTNPEDADLTKAVLLGRPDPTTSTGWTYRGKFAICAIYDRWLNNTQVQELIDLCQTWVDTGAAPEDVPLETSTTFGPVQTTDTSATLKWRWSSDQVDWYDIDDATNPLLGVQWEIDTDGAQPGNLLNITSATATKVVYLRCKATTNYEPGGITSNVNTLTIVEAT